MLIIYMSFISDFLERAQNKIQNINTTQVFTIAAIISIFLGLSFYIYNYYVLPKMKPTFVPNMEFVDTENKMADIYLFWTDWCPYSKKTLPIWYEIKNKYNNEKVNHYKLHFTEIDCEKQKDQLKIFEDTYNKEIKEYPSIFIVKDNKVIEYDTNVDKDTLDNFINTVL